MRGLDLALELGFLEGRIAGNGLLSTNFYHELNELELRRELVG